MSGNDLKKEVMTMKRELTAIALVAVSVVLMAIGCRRKEEGEGKYRIAVIPKGTTHVFWKSIHAGALKAQQDLKDSGLDIEIIWKGPLKEDDRESQIRVVEDLITRGVSGIVLAPSDDMALRMPVRDAVDDGIPVVIIDSGLKARITPVSWQRTTISAAERAVSVLPKFWMERAE